MKLLSNLIINEDGQGMAEYVLIIGLVSVALIIALDLIGIKIAGIADTSNEKINDAVN